MANFDAIAGLSIPVLSADPSNPIQGELWYNTTADKFRGYGLYQVNAAWSSAPSGLNAGRRSCPGAGTVDDGIGFAGYIGGYPRYGGTETYNGSSWSTGPGLPTPLGASLTHIGTGSEAAGVGGYYYSGPYGFVSNYNIQWNGSSWSTATALPANRYGLGGCGNGSDDYQVAGGANANGGYFPQTTSWSWNGSAWSSEPAANWTPGTSCETMSFGTSTSDWFATVDSATTAMFEYNGTSWSTSPATFAAATSGRSIWGNSDSATTTGGPAGPATTTQTWNGSAWATSPATSNSNHVAALRSNSTSSGTDGWVFGGGPGNGISAGETFVGPVSGVQKVNLDFS
tara:strand:- start:264 stop:1289 length:1026 start_codon:yes stop_codon:yes gene_type:complete